MEDIYFNSLIWKEGNAYVSYCPQFDVSSCGDTVEEARRMLKEAVYLFIEVAQEQGTLQTILEEAGYQLELAENDREWQPPRLVATELMSISTEG
jgi:predicted RNase H-like HicB family nuclease